MRTRSIAIVLGVATTMLVAACGGSTGADAPIGGPSATSVPSGPGAPSGAPSGTVRLLAHDSFVVSEALLSELTAQTGLTVEVVTGGDAGSMVAGAVLAAGSPTADVMFGVDNTLVSRAVEAGVFEPYTADDLDAVVPELRQDTANGMVTPIDYGDVCVNIDDQALADRGLDAPETLDDLLEPAYRDLLVVEDPGTSSPGLAFLLATIARYGDGWTDYWSGLADNGVAIASSWTDAYVGQFSGGGDGDRPLVVSYATSPPAEIVYAAEPEAHGPVHVRDDRRLLPAGGVCRRPRRSGQPRRRARRRRLAPVRGRPGRRAAVHVRLPRASRHAPAAGLHGLRSHRPRALEPARSRGRRECGRVAGRLGHGDGALSPPRWLRWAWVAPAAFLGAFLVYPLGVLVGTMAGGSDLGTVADRLAAPSLWRILALAVVQALASTALALAVGLPIANVVSRYRFRGRALAQALVTVPFVLPTVVVALAFRGLVGDRLAQGFALVVLAHAYVNLAVVARIVGAQWAQHDPDIESVARTLGATRWRAFTDVTLPSLRPAIASSAAVVFVFSFSSLGIVLLLGDSSTRTLESQILRQTSVLLDFPGAAATAVVQLVLVSVVLGAGALAGRRSPTRSLRPVRLLPLPAAAVPRAAVVGTAVLSALIVLAPIAALILTSLRAGGDWRLDWWLSMGTVDAGTTRIGSPAAALATSIGFALVTALVAAVVGGLAAVAVLVPGRARVVTLVAMVPLAVSTATLGLGILLAFGRAPIDLRSTGLLIPIAHSLVAVPLVVAVVAPALRSSDSRALAVAASLGARPSRAFATAYGPVLRVVMLASAGLSAAVSLGEFGAASFLTRAGAPTVPVQIVRLLSRPGEQSTGVAAALAVVLVALTLVMVLAVDRLGTTTRRAA